MPPVIVFQGSSGSDTLNSGAPAGDTPLNGSGASVTSASTTIDLSADTPDLSGVPTDGTAAIWVQTTSGGQFFEIASVDDGADTVTIATGDTPSVTESSRNWAIGGARDSIDNADSRTVFAVQNAAGWVVELDDAATQTVTTSSIDVTVAGAQYADGMFIIRGISSRTRPLISCNANTPTFTVGSAGDGYVQFQNLSFDNTNGTKTASMAVGTEALGRTAFIIDCEIGDATNTFWRGLARTSGPASLWAFDSYIHDCTDDGINVGSSAGETRIHRCYIADNSGDGINLTTRWAEIRDNIIVDNGGNGVVYDGSDENTNGAAPWIVGNTIANNTSDGIDLGNQSNLWLENNIISGNGAFGIDADAAEDDSFRIGVGYNCFHNNTSGNTNNWTTQSTDQIDVDPQFTNAGTGDYSIGGNLSADGAPSDVGGAGLTTSYTDIGAAQRQEPAESPATGHCMSMP